MAKELTVNGAFRDGPTVHGNVFGVLSMGKGMDYFRNSFLADAAFTRYQDRNVRWGYLHGLFYGTVELYIVADDLESLFYRLNALHLLDSRTKNQEPRLVLNLVP